MVDLATLATGVATVLGGAAAWRQSKRSQFATITNRLDRELKEERQQRRLLTQAYIDLHRWARQVDPGGPAGPPPDPPNDLELLSW